MNIFSIRLKELRLEKDLTLEQLATDLNRINGTSFSKGMLSKYENDKVDADMQSVIPIAKYFNVCVDYLIGVSNDKNCIKKKNPKIILSENEEIIITNYRSLNESGKEYVRDQIENAMQLPKYQKRDEEKMA